MRVITVLFTVAACIGVAASASAADPVKPDPSSPAASAVERDADAGQPRKPAAQAPKPPVTELRFDPPPVPEFMLRKPEQPLTLEQMKQQADEAAEKEKARRARAAGAAGPSKAGTDAAAPGGASQ